MSKRDSTKYSKRCLCMLIPYTKRACTIPGEELRKPEKTTSKLGKSAPLAVQWSRDIYLPTGKRAVKPGLQCPMMYNYCSAKNNCKPSYQYMSTGCLYRTFIELAIIFLCVQSK